MVLLTAVLASVPRVVKHRDEAPRAPSRESGRRILRRRPVAARLLLVEFFFNFLYMPIEVPFRHVRGTWTPMRPDGASCGVRLGLALSSVPRW